ncbi:MAG: DUF4416 family protein [Deltaproteobacteria bacterium]|nr:DUF4416 family protein [Deltaproteobacteria bacterium]
MRQRKPDPVKLLISIFTGEERLFSEVLLMLKERFGEMDLLSERLDFPDTDYYEDEFGKGIKRKIASFDRLIGPEELSAIKVFTNGIEEGLSKDGKRRVNIDPGYIALEKFVLASCKNFSHRIYLKDSVYADLTLIYEGRVYRALEWTYPDYKEQRMQDILMEVRKRYAFSLGKGLHG